MANQEHLDILKQGVETWNQWKINHAEIKPNLSGFDLSGLDLKEADLREINLSKASLYKAALLFADLSEADLSGANLSGANLSEAKLINTTLIGAILNNADLNEANLNRADLSFADLYGANLHGANLIGTHLHGANLNRADLSFADLVGTVLSEADIFGVNLWGANLYGTDLYRADLVGTVLNEADLIGTDLSEAIVGWTSFGDCDLRFVKGLETVRHRGPSPLSIKTLYISEGEIPEIFLRGAGVPDVFITYVRSLVGSVKPLDYFTCFISYSSKDQDFAERLHADLQSKGVLCWFAPEDLKWGEKIHTGIDEAIRLHDKLLLILSKNSVESGWVEREVKTALAKERKEKRTVLFPIRVDHAIFDSPYDWATEIRHERNIGDFTRWKQHDEYQKAFNRLLRDLKAEASHRL